MIDLEDDVFQAQCQIENLNNYLEEGGTIESVKDDLVTMNLPGNSYTEINLRPIQYLLDELRKMT